MNRILTQVPKKAGLSKSESKHFLEGWKGKHSEFLILEREKYTQLQFEVESAVLELFKNNPRNNPWESSFMLFAYYTFKPSTPIYRSSHPRYDLIRKMLLNQHREDKFAFFVCCKAGIDSLASLPADQKPSHEEKEAALVFLRREGSVSSFTFTDCDIEENYMALHSGNNSLIENNLSALAFRATQMKTPDEISPGQIIFGEKAQEMYNSAMDEMGANELEGKSRLRIIKLLEKIWQ